MEEKTNQSGEFGINNMKGGEINHSKIAGVIGENVTINNYSQSNLSSIESKKKEAFAAEEAKNFKSAKELWHIILVATGGLDKDATNAFQRLGAQTQQEYINLLDEEITNLRKNLADNQQQLGLERQEVECKIKLLEEKLKQALEKSPEKASVKEVKLESARGIDYTKLEYLLATKDFLKADEETEFLIHKVLGKEIGDKLREDINSFPCEDLRTIDQLWLKYSNERFGFSVQKQIFKELGGFQVFEEANGFLDKNEKMKKETWENFESRVGWRQYLKKRKGRLFGLLGIQEKWVYELTDWESLNFATTAPLGHLPAKISRNKEYEIHYYGDKYGPPGSKHIVIENIYIGVNIYFILTNCGL